LLISQEEVKKGSWLVQEQGEDMRERKVEIRRQAVTTLATPKGKEKLLAARQRQLI
jgi:hypothetical protein